MEIEQIIKKLDWLDEERRKDKTMIASLQERLASFETNQPDVLQQINELNEEVAGLSAYHARFEKLEGTISQAKVDLSRKVDNLAKTRTEREREMEKIRLGDLENLNKSLGDLRKKLDPLKEIKKSLNMRVEEEARLSRLVEELENRLEEFRRTDEDTKRLQTILEDGRRQDSKRLMDMQNEVMTLRKRYDEQRGKLDLITDDLQKADLRLKELISSEQEQQREQKAFLEKQNLFQVERNREWHEWQARFDEFSSRAATLDAQIQSLETVNKAAKRAQEGFEEISSRLVRRINEITEMHRLMEERARNDWNGFKTEDQNRWTNHSLVVEEKFRDINRRGEKLDQRVVTLEDKAQEIHDVLLTFLGDTNKGFNNFINILKEWYDENEGLLGHIK